ncbi:MAG: hypothetical protein AcusKO_17940 [Acuticoccus sp.]
MPIGQIEDLRNAVLGAGLEATQMSTGALSGGMAFAQRAGMVFSSGLIGGRVTLSGSLSHDAITLGVGLHLPPGTRHWLHEAETGGVGIFRPGDEHDAVYPPGSIYASVTLSAEALEEEAAQRDLVLDASVLGGTRIHARKLDPGVSSSLRSGFRRLHAGRTTAADRGLDRAMLCALVGHLARPPVDHRSRYRPTCHGMIVRRARAFIAAHLADPLSIEQIAAAAGTSRRTLFRAFIEVLDEPPQAFVRRLRLHRIRDDLAGDLERACTIALVANEWGMSDLGRMAACYRELFGEPPSATLARRRSDAEDAGTMEPRLARST